LVGSPESDFQEGLPGVQQFLQSLAHWQPPELPLPLDACFATSLPKKVLIALNGFRNLAQRRQNLLLPR
jgi:hypothetical protein